MGSSAVDAEALATVCICSTVEFGAAVTFLAIGVSCAAVVFCKDVLFCAASVGDIIVLLRATGSCAAWLGKG